MRKFNSEELIKLTEIFWQNIKTDGDSYPCWLWTGDHESGVFQQHYHAGQPQFKCDKDEFPVFCEDYDSRLVNIPRLSLYLMEEADSLLYNADIYWTCNNPSKCCNPEHMVVDDSHLDRIPY